MGVQHHAHKPRRRALRLLSRGSPRRAGSNAADCGDAQKKAADAFAQGRGYAVRGPFVPLMRSPEVMLRAKAMGDYLRFKSTLGPRLNEMVILITAREWTQQYEWNAHYPAAMKAGLRAEIADAI